MTWAVIGGVLLPFFGTALGAACVFLIRRPDGRMPARVPAGLAAGVMTAASVWSLLLPSLEMAADRGVWRFIPAAVGLGIGFCLFCILDRLVPRLMPPKDGERPSVMALAVTLHNLPEGMAVGAVFAGCRMGRADVPLMAAMALSVGIAIQDLPEGAILSLMENRRRMGRGRAFLFGVLSGAVEPLGSAAVLAAAGVLIPAMPYLLAFAAGAMLYVVVEELVPQMAGGRVPVGTLCFALGFLLMMALDVALG